LGIIMQRQRNSPITLSEEINEALRLEILGEKGLPIVAVQSDEHGPLIVMRAVDMAAVFAYVRRPTDKACSRS